MKVVIIGAGASGVVAAINYKRNHKKDDVVIIEHLDKPLKKILATGNGKCNLGNSNIIFKNYTNSEFAKKVLQDYDYVNLFESISIKTKLVDSLAYPVSESAVSVREALLNEVNKLKITIKCEEKLIDYKPGNQITIITNKNTYIADKLILAGGLCSSPKLGSDGSLLSLLKSHNYKIKSVNPGLSPLYTKEKTKTLDGIRCKCNVLLKDKDVIHEEKGEVLFKDHGLSGIVIFNTMSVIAKNISKQYKICLDLLPDFSMEYLENYCKNHTFSEFLLAFINPKISAYLIDRFNTNDAILKAIKNLEFTFDKSYGFDFSQVSVGGVLVDEVDDNLMSKKEKNIYLIGEILDVDGPCGGYNLTWAFGSAIKATN